MPDIDIIYQPLHGHYIAITSVFSRKLDIFHSARTIARWMLRMRRLLCHGLHALAPPAIEEFHKGPCWIFLAVDPKNRPNYSCAKYVTLISSRIQWM